MKYVEFGCVVGTERHNVTQMFEGSAYQKESGILNGEKIKKNF